MIETAIKAAFVVLCVLLIFTAMGVVPRWFDDGIRPSEWLPWLWRYSPVPEGGGPIRVWIKGDYSKVLTMAWNDAEEVWSSVTSDHAIKPSPSPVKWRRSR